MAHEIIKYKNKLNEFSFSGLTSSEMDIVFAIFNRFKEKGRTEIEFSEDKLRELIDYRHKGMTFGDFAFKAFTHIQGFKITCPDLTTEGGIMSVIVFPVIRYAPKKATITVKISQEIADYLNAISDHFTRFELAEFVNLQSGYAKTLYRLLKQYRSTGWAKFEWQEFLRLIGAPATYSRQTYVDSNVLKPAIKELQKPQDLFDTKRQPFKNLRYEKIKGKGRGRGGKVIGIRFTFDPIPDPSNVPEDFQLEPQTMADIERMNEES